MYYYFGVNMDNLEVVEYDVSDEVYDWILSQLDCHIFQELLVQKVFP